MNIFLAIVIFVVSFFNLEASYEGDLRQKNGIAIAAIFRDEACYLKEWIEYHKLVGIKKFYLYNNISQNHYQMRRKSPFL